MSHATELQLFPILQSLLISFKKIYANGLQLDLNGEIYDLNGRIWKCVAVRTRDQREPVVIRSGAAIRSLHAGAETVHFDETAVIGLKRSLWHYFPSDSVHASQRQAAAMGLLGARQTTPEDSV